MKLLFLFVLTFVSSIAIAATAQHGGGGIPASEIYKAINFVIYAALLYFLLRNKVSGFFKDRVANFEQARIKAEAARAEAEKQKQEVLTRLQTLQNTADQSIANARTEAEELRKKIVREAQDLSLKLKEDARSTAEIELQRAKTELRDELLTQAIVSAKIVLSEKINEPDQKRLQSEFVEKIGVVR